LAADTLTPTTKEAAPAPLSQGALRCDGAGKMVSTAFKSQELSIKKAATQFINIVKEGETKCP
jgi:hypothetical protein